MKLRQLIFIAFVLLMASSGTALAGSKAGGDLGVGFQSSWPASYGLSAKFDLNEKMTAQGVLGLLGTVQNYSGRLLYRFQDKEEFDLYGFGSLGMYRYDYYLGDETAFGFGAGAGIEYDLSNALDGIPLTVSGEIGLGFVSFDYYSYGALGFGVGFHYWLEKK